MFPERLRRSLVLRTLLVVLAAAALVGLLVVGVAERVARDWETRRQRESVAGLLDVVAPSASAAAYAQDRVLAEEVVRGLIGTPMVRAATLRAGDQVLAEASRGRAGIGKGVSRTLESPFAPGQSLGELSLVPDPDLLELQEARAAVLARMLVLALVLVLGSALGVAVHRLIVRPITRLSDRLHLMDPDSGGRLRVPAGHEGDEIGRLVDDVNALVKRMVTAMWQEQEASRLLRAEQRKAPPAGTGLFVARGDGALEAWTPPFLGLLGLELTPPAPGARLAGLFGEGAGQVEAALATCLQGVPASGLVRLRNSDGVGHRWLQIALEPIGPGWCQGLVEDVSSSSHSPVAGAPVTRDGLTGALSRLGVEYALEHRFARGARGIGALLVELEGLPRVIGQFGAEAGDTVLRRVVLRLAAAVRRTDSVARLDGDSFLVVLDRLEDADAGERIAEKILAVLAAPFLLDDGQPARIGASLGLTLRRPGEEPGLSILLGRADHALGQAKAAGGNCWRLV